MSPINELTYRLEYGAYDEDDLLCAQATLLMRGIDPTADRVAEYLAAEDEELRRRYGLLPV
jgi:hypothetical protein